MSAARGAAVPRKPISCTRAPQSSRDGLGNLWEAKPFLSERLYLGDPLAGNVHTAEESTQVTGENHKCDCGRLDGQSVTGQKSSMLALCPNMDETHRPDQHTRNAAEQQMHQEDALEPLPFELPLPGENSADQHWRRDHCRRQQIAVRRSGQKLPFLSTVPENRRSLLR